MKTKLVAILMILLFSGIFTACSEEEVNPQVDSKMSRAAGVSVDETDNI